MIETLPEYKITSRDGPFINVECNTKIINTLVRKINNLVDAVNALVEENNIHEKQIDELQMTKVHTAVDKANRKLELAEYYKNELERTRKALEQSETCCSKWEKQALDYKAELIKTKLALDVAVDALRLFESGKYTPQPDSYGLKTDASRFARTTINQIEQIV